MKNKFSILYKILFSLLLASGMLIRLGLSSNQFYTHVFFSFTNLSNLLVLVVTIYSSYSLLCKSKESQWLSQLRISSVLAILITGIIYHFILVPEKIIENPAYTIFTYSNIICHYVAPIGMTLDWLLFDEKGKIKKTDPLKWLSIPLGYFLFALFYGSLGNTLPGKSSSYPYFFLDLDKLGVLGVAGWSSLLLLGILIIFYIIYFVDQALANYQHSKK